MLNLLVINRLERSSAVLSTTIHFYTSLADRRDRSVVFLRFIESSFAGFLSSFESEKAEWKHHWSSFIHFQFPRILASSFESSGDEVLFALETFTFHNELMLNQINRILNENFLAEIFNRILFYVDDRIRQENEQNVNRLLSIIDETRSKQLSSFESNVEPNEHFGMASIVSLQRRSETNLRRILTSPLTDDKLDEFLSSIELFVPMILAMDKLNYLIELLFSRLDEKFELILYLLCYLTRSIDESPDDSVSLNVQFDRSSSAFLVFVWMKKYWFSRSFGHALFGSSLSSIEFLSSFDNSVADRLEAEKNQFLQEIYSERPTENVKHRSNTEFLSKTILLLGELQSLALDDTKQIVEALILFLRRYSAGCLVHLLLWLIANYQIASETDRAWIQQTIELLGWSRIFLFFRPRKPMDFFPFLWF